uniref:Transmembrane protein 144b n=1 Tax=Pygocentrus nattereri TaxID=42514 RepID=A0A3B4CTU2_PYGNA
MKSSQIKGSCAPLSPQPEPPCNYLAHPGHFLQCMWPLHMDSMKSSGLRMSLLLITLLFGFCCLITVIAGEVGESSSAKDEAAGGIFTHSTYMDKIYGFLSCLVAVLLYGSNFVPVKKVNTGDGMFFQWISCAAIWVVGLVGDTLFRSSKAHPAAMLGGVIWATGNITSVPVVKCIGLGLGLLLWGASGLLIGWASSRFGLFGLDPEEVSKPVLNYCGAGLCLLSAVIFFFVKSDVQNPTSLEATPILIEERSLSDIPLPSDSWVDTISPKTKRPLGCIIAVLSGFLSGSAFVPMLYIKHHATSNSSMFAGSSQNDLDYCFAQSSGIFIASTVYFTMYCAVMKNRPRIYPRAILPGAWERPAVCFCLMCGADRLSSYGLLKNLRSTNAHQLPAGGSTYHKTTSTPCLTSYPHQIII